MIRNYLLTAWRNLQKNKFNATINVIGLSVAFTCCILLFLMVQYEFSYDSFQRNGDHLYKAYDLSHAASGDKRGESMAFPAAPAMKKEVAGVVHTTGLMSAGAGIRYKGKEVFQRITLVDPDFFGMFSFPIVAGNAASPLAELSDVVLAQSTATALFGGEDPVGKPVEIKVAGQWKAVTVSAVIADAPENSSVQYYILARTEIHPNYPNQKNSWDEQHHPVFVQLAASASVLAAEKDLRQLVKRHGLVNEIQMKSQGYHKDANGDYYAIRLERIADLHFDPDLGGRNSMNKAYLYTLMLIAGIVMLIACFNFVNLNVARSFTRAREVGIRKTIGAGRRQIYFQLWAESLLLFVVAAVIAVGASSMLLQRFNDLFTEKLKLETLLQPGVLLVALAGAVLVSFLAGGYPAWLVSRFNTVEVLKGKVSVRGSGLLRSGLITFQFVLASALISGTLVIYRQFNHLRTASLGYVQESVISIPLKNPENAQRYANELRMDLGSQPWMAGITGSSVNIGIGQDGSMSHSGLGFTIGDKGFSTTMLQVDYDYLSVLGMKPLAGRDFSRDFGTDTSTSVTNVVVTESMAREFGVKNVQDVVGMSFLTDSSGPKWNIIGVIPDFHLYSMNERLAPTTLFLQRHGGLNYLFVKVRTTNPAMTLGLVQAAFHRLEPDNPTAASYLTENTARWYDKERRLSSIFFTSAFIAILLSCLGLFAIVSLVMKQRRKEIGVRKVLGASIPAITGLLSKDFIRLVAIAFLLSTPVAWYFLDRWLRNFEYRVAASWWVFVLAGATTLVIALVTVGIQTVRAAVENPVRSLRSE
ncbi:ABC transporter permease [Puia dinghuensis]|uniref:ABC transporter permease n=1 Tax=Puia dinghuensis TaxID=1792502 RepID=A0A8J2XSC6_9BACT|nr:ABC transporter permease [Puia dinghuensis]GGA93906.1 ABC transporter permease [Puia dinghuensis]